jgi:hypothetical protein
MLNNHLAILICSTQLRLGAGWKGSEPSCTGSELPRFGASSIGSEPSSIGSEQRLARLRASSIGSELNSKPMELAPSLGSSARSLWSWLRAYRASARSLSSWLRAKGARHRGYGALLGAYGAGSEPKEPRTCAARLRA